MMKLWKIQSALYKERPMGIFRSTSCVWFCTEFFAFSVLCCRFTQLILQILFFLLLAHCYLKPELWMSMKEVVFSFWRLNRLHQSLLCFSWGKPIALFTSGSPLPTSYSLSFSLPYYRLRCIFLYVTIDWLAVSFLFYVWFKLNFYLSYFKFLNSIPKAYLNLIFTSFMD